MTWIPSLKGGVPRPELHDLTHSPVGLWQLNGDLTDSSGNGLTLSVASGTARYGPGIRNDLRSFYFDGATRLVSAIDALVQITGAVTLEALIYTCQVQTNVHGVICGGTNTDGDAAQNILYSLSWGAANALYSVFETGTGSDVVVQPAKPFPLMPDRWHHLAYTRSGAGANKQYHDGTLVHSGSEGNPTGGTSARMHIGSHDGAVPFQFGYISSVKLIASELNALQVAAEAQRTLPLRSAP